MVGVARIVSVLWCPERERVAWAVNELVGARVVGDSLVRRVVVHRRVWEGVLPGHNGPEAVAGLRR